MSVKLPFKPVFAIDMDQELLDTTTQQVQKFLKPLEESLSKSLQDPQGIMQKSINYVIDSKFSVSFLAQTLLSLFFLERSFVKATESSITKLVNETQSHETIKDLIALIETWSKDYEALFSVYTLKKGSTEERIIQLTDTAFKWVDSFVPITKKYEYRLFKDSFHQSALISNEDTILNILDLQTKKKVLVYDQTKSVADLEKNILQNVTNNTLSILICDSSGFEVKQFLFFLTKNLLSSQKKVLFQKLDFFKVQFAELFNVLGLVYISSIDYISFTDQYEIINSLRNTSSIILLSEESWSKFKDHKLFTHEIRTYVYPQKNLANKPEREYIEKFCSNYVETSSLTIQSVEKNDLVQTLVEKSAGSIAFINQSLDYIKRLSITTYTDKFLNELPAGELGLHATMFKKHFMDIDNGSLDLQTLITLVTIQTKFGITTFSKNQLINLHSVLQATMGTSGASDDQTTTGLMDYFTSTDNLYTIASNTTVSILTAPSRYFDDEKTEDFAIKKLFLIIQNVIAELPDLNYEDIFKKMLIDSLQTSDISEKVLNLMDLMIIDPDFQVSLQQNSFDIDALWNEFKRIKDNESDLLTKPLLNVVELFLYKVEFLFDSYLVKGSYKTSERLLTYLEKNYDLLDTEHEARFHFQKSRQFIAQGELEKAHVELTETIKLVKQTKNYWTLAVVLRLLAETYFINRQPLFSTYCFDQIFQLFGRVLPDKQRFKGYSLLKASDRLNEAGLFALSLQNIEKALDLFHEKNLLLEELNGRQKIADILYKLGSTDIAVNELTLAIQSLGDDLDEPYKKRLEAIKNVFANPEIYHPLYSYKNWTKINYVNIDTLKLQEERYEKIFTENRDKEVSEEVLQQMIYYLRLLFKLGKIQDLRLVLDYLERHIPAKSQNKGLLYLELSLIHNFLANIDIANYYCDLAKSSLFSLPIDYDISIRYQLNFIGFQLYNARYELAELLLQDQFLRKRRKQEADLYLFYAALESHKRPPNDFEKFYEKGKSLQIGKSARSLSKQDIKLYGSSILFDTYQDLFPITNLPKKDVEIIEEIQWLFCGVTIDGTTGSYTSATQKLSKIEELVSQITDKDWKDDLTINYLKKSGQIYYNDKSSPENSKKCIYNWQNALKKITFAIKENPRLYLFERLDLMYLIGKSVVQFGLLESEEANKYLLSGKNLIRKHNVHNSLQLEFQFDTALATNYFDSKNYEQAIKYYTRALDKHDNKLYAELQSILLNLFSSYLEMNKKDEIKKLIQKYREYIRIFNIQEDLEKKGLEKELFT